MKKLLLAVLALCALLGLVLFFLSRYLLHMAHHYQNYQGQPEPGPYDIPLQWLYVDRTRFPLVSHPALEMAVHICATARLPTDAF